MLFVVVNDMLLASTHSSTLSIFKADFQHAVDVQCYGYLRSIIRWDTIHGRNGVALSQMQYSHRLLQRFGFNI